MIKVNNKYNVFAFIYLEIFPSAKTVLFQIKKTCKEFKHLNIDKHGKTKT